MSALASPDDDTLREFLLGLLPAARVEQVRVWLDADPAHAARFDQLNARDPLTDAVTDGTPDEPIPPDTIERVLRAVSAALNTPGAGYGDTPSPTTDGATVSGVGSLAPVQPQQPPAWPPVLLGGYRIVRELGHGGMGYVFEAEDEKLGRRVAIKVLTPDLAKRPDAAARFLREARAAAAVDHENVVPVLHVGDEAGTPYMVMPLLQGDSLADRLKRGAKLPAKEVVRIGRDVAAGLGAAHAKGLVHRDLKPANIWLDANTGRARVLDFGLARQGDGADALTQAGALLGTPAYMSPEQLDGHPASARSDLFALGAVLYECATGKRAFDGPTITAILKAVSDHNPPAPGELNPDVPAGLSALIVQLLAKNPAGRPATAAAVLAALAGDLVTPDASASPTATWVDRPVAAKTRTQRQFQIGCVITISLCLLVGVGFAAMQSRERDRERDREAAQLRDEGDLAKRRAEEATEAARLAEAAHLARDAVRSTALVPSPPTRYRGNVDVKLARTKDDPLMRLNVAGTLPMRKSDSFRIDAEVDPPAYLYLVWVDPDHDITPVYPWNAAKGWGSRPATEEPRSKLSLPADVGKRYAAAAAKPGVATMVLFACEKPLDVSDDVIEKWFKELPELQLPPGRDDGVVWFDNYAEVKDPLRLRTFDEVEADVFARWQGQLKKSIGGRASFQSAVSFARTGNKK